MLLVPPHELCPDCKRVDPQKPLKDFIYSMAQRLGKNPSEFCRDVIVYFQMGYLMGEFHKPFPEMKVEFLQRARGKSGKQSHDLIT